VDPKASFDLNHTVLLSSYTNSVIQYYILTLPHKLRYIANQQNPKRVDFLFFLARDSWNEFECSKLWTDALIKRNTYLTIDSSVYIGPEMRPSGWMNWKKRKEVTKPWLFTTLWRHLSTDLNVTFNQRMAVPSVNRSKSIKCVSESHRDSRV